MSIPVFVLQVGMSVEYHQAAFTFQISHVLRYAHMRWYCHKHVDMFWAALRLYDFHSFSFTQLSEDLPHVCLDFPIYHLSAILWRKHDMIVSY